MKPVVSDAFNEGSVGNWFDMFQFKSQSVFAFVETTKREEDTVLLQTKTISSFLRRGTVKECGDAYLWLQED